MSGSMTSSKIPWSSPRSPPGTGRPPSTRCGSGSETRPRQPNPLPRTSGPPTRAQTKSPTSSSGCGSWAISSGLASAQSSLDERDLEHLLVNDGSVTEVAVLAKEVAVVRRDCHPRVHGEHVEETLEDAVEILHGSHLASAQGGHLVVVEKGCLGNGPAG